MEPYHFRRMGNQYVMEYRWSLGILYVVGSLPYANPESVETSRSNTLAMRNMPYGTFPSQWALVSFAYVYSWCMYHVTNLINLRHLEGHNRLERIRKEHDSKACSSYI